MSAPSFRAITTHYKGYAFRSRLEARWAVFFDHLKIRWDYEPEGFELGNGLRYLPDFWLPDLQLWVEIKPGKPDHVASAKAWGLVENSGFALYMASGLPDGIGTLFATFDGDNGIQKLSFPALVSWHVKKPSVMLLDDGAHQQVEKWGCVCMDQWNTVPAIIAERTKNRRAPLSGNGVKALEVARGARFEFGAKGAA